MQPSLIKNADKSPCHAALLCILIQVNSNKYYLFDKIIFSPTIIYGLDSQMERPVFCAYTCSTIDSFQMYQQLSRTRNIEKLFFYFYVKPIRKRKYECVENVREEQYAIRDWLESSYELIGKNKIYDLVQELKIMEKFNQDEIRQNDYKFFVSILKDKGFIVKTKNDKKAQNLKTDKDLVDKYYQEIFDYDKNLINRFMKLSMEEALKNINLLCNPFILLKHLNLISYFIENTNSSIHTSLRSMAYSAFPDKIVQNKFFKMNLLNNILKLIDCGKNEIVIKNTKVDKDELKRLYTDYRLIKPEQKLKNTNVYGLMFVIKNLTDELFPTKLYIKKKIRTDGTTEQKWTYKLVIDETIYEYHKYLSTFRKIDKRVDFIDNEDDDNDDGDEETLKIL